MKLLNAFALSILTLFSLSLNAETTSSWRLDATNSKVNFVSIKKGNIAETHVFNDVSGSVVDGNASIIIKPDSVESKVPIRNERMREFLFETGVYPTIEVTANVNDALAELTPGNSSIATLPAALAMHGVSKEISLEVRITKLSANTLIVASTQPVLIRAADFNMVEGITKLASLVNNLPIAESIPVNFSLQLSKS